MVTVTGTLASGFTVTLGDAAQKLIQRRVQKEAAVGVTVTAQQVFTNVLRERMLALLEEFRAERAALAASADAKLTPDEQARVDAIYAAALARADDPVLPQRNPKRASATKKRKAKKR
jgi:hypothetical protein